MKRGFMLAIIRSPPSLHKKIRMRGVYLHVTPECLLTGGGKEYIISLIESLIVVYDMII